MPPRIEELQLWQDPGNPGMLVVTTNNFVTRSGNLVMGTGAAKEAADRIPGIEKECGNAVLENGSRYGFLEVRPPRPEEGERGKRGFGIFQTKNDPQKPSDLSLIKNSVEKLNEYARSHPDVQIRMNYPGIGYGRLKRKDVEPLLMVLPENVTICYREFFSVVRVCDRGKKSKKASTKTKSQPTSSNPPLHSVSD